MPIPKPNTMSPTQKTIGAVVLGMSVLSLVHLFFWRPFIASESGVLVGLIIALVSTIALAAAVEIIDRRSGWVSDPMLQFRSPLRQAFTWMGAMVAAFCLTWFVVSWPIARIITAVWGQPHSFSITVVKTESTSSRRRRQCSHHLQYVGEAQPFLFRFCLSEESYARLPSDPFPATFYGHRTALGFQATGVRIER